MTVILSFIQSAGILRDKPLGIAEQGKVKKKVSKKSDWLWGRMSTIIGNFKICRRICPLILRQSVRPYYFLDKTCNPDLINDIDENNLLSKTNTFNLQNYPNPFMQNTEISYYLEFPGNVNMEILDPFGHFICNRQIGFQTKGNQTFSLDCSALTPGVYWYSIAVGNKREWQKMIKIE